jgi:hypothetical protein
VDAAARDAPELRMIRRKSERRVLVGAREEDRPAGDRVGPSPQSQYLDVVRGVPREVAGEAQRGARVIRRGVRLRERLGLGPVDLEPRGVLLFVRVMLFMPEIGSVLVK